MFTNDNLLEVSFGTSTLDDANFANANLSGATFSRNHGSDDTSTIAKAGFGYANLQNAKFDSIDFTQVVFEGANFKNTSFVKPQNLFNSQIKSACNWKKASFFDNLPWADTEVIKKAHQASQLYIEQLKQDKASNPKYSPDCSRWLS